MLPFQVMLAPLFTLVNRFGLINTYVGIILPYLAFGVPYQVFILHGFFSEVPKELSEAALVDGASHFTIFRRIFLPISLPVLAALLILDFVATWNEFAMALVILQDNSTWTLPLGLMSFQSQFSERLRPAQRGDRHDRAAGDDRLPDLPALFRLGSHERRDQGVENGCRRREVGICSRPRSRARADGNPFVDVTLDVDFALGDRRVSRARLL